MGTAGLGISEHWEFLDLLKGSCHCIKEPLAVCAESFLLSLFKAPF